MPIFDDYESTYVSGVKGGYAIVPPSERSKTKSRIAETTQRNAQHLRKLDMLDRLFLRQDPRNPVLRAVGQASEDDPRHLQPGASESDWNIEPTS